MRSLGLVFLFLAMNVYAQTAPTAAEAQEFMNKAEAQLADLNVKVQRASWVQENFITDDTQAMAADAIDENTAVTTQLVEKAKSFDGLTLPPDLARKFLLLKLSLTAPAPNDPSLRREMTEIGVSLDADYGKGKYCRKPDECLDITAIEKHDGHQPQSERTQRRLGRMAQYRRTHAATLLALRRSLQPGRAGNWLQRHRRPVARRL